MQNRDGNYCGLTVADCANWCQSTSSTGFKKIKSSKSLTRKGHDVASVPHQRKGYSKPQRHDHAAGIGTIGTIGVSNVRAATMIGGSRPSLPPSDRKTGKLASKRSWDSILDATSIDSRVSTRDKKPKASKTDDSDVFDTTFGLDAAETASLRKDGDNEVSSSQRVARQGVSLRPLLVSGVSSSIRLESSLDLLAVGRPLAEIMSLWGSSPQQVEQLRSALFPKSTLTLSDVVPVVIPRLASDALIHMENNTS